MNAAAVSGARRPDNVSASASTLVNTNSACVENGWTERRLRRLRSLPVTQTPLVVVVNANHAHDTPNVPRVYAAWAAVGAILSLIL